MAERPNILLIMTDQHSPHIAGFAGNRSIDTEALDRLAETGTSFNAAYCQSPLCVPSRMSLWSGRYAHTISAWDNQSALPANAMTLPKWLSQHGYTTASVGKMHFRGSEQMHGFQYRPYGDLVDSPVPCHQPDPPDTVDGRSSNHAVGRFPFAGASSIPEALHSDTIVTRESLSWLLERDSEQLDTPWFFCASYYRPHFPLTAPGRYIRKYGSANIPLPQVPPNYPHQLHPHDDFIVKDFNLAQFSLEETSKALAAYYAALDYIDDQIGQLLAELESTGILENTYVIYTSDHGELAGEHGLWWKRSYYEASCRVPLLITGPDISEGLSVNTPVELVDLFPTCCEIADLEEPPSLDGERLLSLLRNRHQTRRKHAARSELLGGNQKTRFRMIRDTTWKFVDFPAAPPRLFNLEEDADELIDLISVADREIISNLQDLLNQGGSWESIEACRTSEVQTPHIQSGNSSGQFRLSDGRIIEADDHLYDDSSLT